MSHLLEHIQSEQANTWQLHDNTNRKRTTLPHSPGHRHPGQDQDVAISSWADRCVLAEHTRQTQGRLFLYNFKTDYYKQKTQPRNTIPSRRRGIHLNHPLGCKMTQVGHTCDTKQGKMINLKMIMKIDMQWLYFLLECELANAHSMQDACLLVVILYTDKPLLLKSPYQVSFYRDLPRYAANSGLYTIVHAAFRPAHPVLVFRTEILERVTVPLI
jgi:hypothetical protein